MGALKKLFGVENKESHEDTILKEIEGEHIEVLHMSDTLRQEIENIEARLHKVWKMFMNKRSEGKSHSEEFMKNLRNLEHQLGLEEKKIKQEIIVEAQDIHAVVNLLENLENMVENM